jgi:hypothetical protein
MIKQLEKSVRVKERAETANPDVLIREYKQTRWVSNSDSIGKPDALSAWYSIEDIENFLSEAKSNGGDGIKFYFAAYPKNYSPKPEYAGRQTLVTVATRSKVTAAGEIANKDLYISRNGQTKILCSYDPPKICPPNCPPPSEGGMGDLGITIVDKGDKGMEII